MGLLLLGVDIGTSSTKGVLCTPDGEVIAEVSLLVGVTGRTGYDVSRHQGGTTGRGGS